MKLSGIRKILTVGDLHLNSTAPETRIDDYSITCLKKLNQIYDIAVKENYNIVILTGDLFHKTQQSLKYINKVVKVFRKFKDNDIFVFSIAGNHDLAYKKIKYLDQSPIGNLFLSGLIKRLGELKIETDVGYKVKINGFDYPEEIKKSDGEGDINICVAHRYYEIYNEDVLFKDDIVSLGYQLYILGHDHVSYNFKKVGSSYIIRPGSLLRGTSHDYQLERDVVVDGVVFNGDRNKPKINLKREKLDIMDAENVFTSRVFHNKKDKGDDLLESISRNIDKVIDQMDNVSESNSVYKVMENMQIDKDVKERIEMYLMDNGIYEVGGEGYEKVSDKV